MHFPVGLNNLTNVTLLNVTEICSSQFCYHENFVKAGRVSMSRSNQIIILSIKVVISCCIGSIGIGENWACKDVMGYWVAVHKCEPVYCMSV